MRQLLLAVAVVSLAAAVVQSAWADPPGRLGGPPTENWFNIGACVAQGGQQVTAGQPFALRLGRWIDGTRGLVESFVPKDASTVLVERPHGTAPASVAFQWQSTAPVPASDPLFAGMWQAVRWSPVFTLSAGEQMTLTLTVASALPARDLAPPSSTFDPTDIGLPPYDGTGLVYNGGIVSPFTMPPVSCTVTAA